jgi:TATA-box binding protein (TBP) (component of TFIID and TFIIIB)
LDIRTKKYDIIITASSTNQLAMFNPTPYKVSTITATGGIKSLIDLDIFYNEIKLSESDTETGFVYIEYGKKKSLTISKGFNKKSSIARRKDKSVKRFDNQVTVILRTISPITNTTLFTNVKVFKNGNIQMTGLKTINQGITTIEYIISRIKMLHESGVVGIVESIEPIKCCDYKIRLINSDFKTGVEIKRDKLNHLLRNKYNIQSSFEPCIYPGVKIQYFWNKNEKGIHDPFDADEKKVTIAVFQSGCIIITGAQTYQQIDEAYKFICKTVDDNLVELKKVLPVLTSVV